MQAWPQTQSAWQVCEDQEGREKGVCTMTRRFALSMVVAVMVLVICCVPSASAVVGNEGFAVETFTGLIENKGALATQAGSHPDSLTFHIVFAHHFVKEVGFEYPYNNPRDMTINLPPGLIFDPTATRERCTEEQLIEIPVETPLCPVGSIVGFLAAHAGPLTLEGSIYNMVPSPGVSADFGINLNGVIIAHIIGGVRAGDDSISAKVNGIVQRDGLWGAIATFNGFPEGPAGKPLLTMPTSCGTPLNFSMTAESWQSEFTPLIPFTPTNGEGRPLTVAGCDLLSFDPELRVQPSSHKTDSPSGLSVELSVPHEETPGSLSQADLKEAVITFPPGFTVSTSAAAGLGACPLLRGTEPEKEQRESRKEETGINLETNEPVNCPNSSKIASVEGVTPLLGAERPLHGAVYLAQQNENPFHNLVTIYLVVEVANVVLKVPGEVSLNPATGQITTRFGEDPITSTMTKEPQFLPQLPFSHLKVNFFGDNYAPLSTPYQCGKYTVTSELTPWSVPESGPPATPSSSFEINEDCHGPLFKPTFLAGDVNDTAGAFTTLTATLRREDGEEQLGGVQVKLPPGLSANVSSVPLCEEPQAKRGECSQASKIGKVTAGVGAGLSQFYVSGEVFLTSPYDGAPFGLAIEVPAVAGPFNLGTVVIRAALNINPLTAAATVTSGPLPQILQGIPLQVRIVNVMIERQGFIFNPTSCAPMKIEGTATSTLGQSVGLSSPFQAAECAALAFKPKFAVSTSGRTSRADGASLDVKLTYRRGSQGTEANIHSVKVELPKQLPSRLATLQKACIAQVFESNPAACPAPSVVGIVRISTPLLSGTLTGPAYFVSHGGEAFPSLIVVAQADGVRADLVGTTFISKKGITSSTFKEAPDVPFSSFELYLPQGKYSALAANGDLCKSTLKMPTAFVAQNGAEIHQSTPIAVTGCQKAKKTKAAKARGTGRASRSRVAGYHCDRKRSGCARR
jgi:hypothetical protein